MLSSDASPPAWRVVLAFVGAPTAAAVALALVMPLYAGLPGHLDRVVGTAVLYALWGAYPTTLVFGLPAFLALRRRLRPTPLSCILVGAAVAAAPWLLLGLFPPPGDAAIDGRATMVDSRTTLWGWIVWAKLVGMIATAGAAGGAMFWLLASARASWRAR